MNQSTTDERMDRLIEAVQQTNVLLEGMKVSLMQLTERSLDHEQRLRTIERWRHNLTPILAALTFLSGVVFSEMIQRVLFQ
jgi:hypothetical protein